MWSWGQHGEIFFSLAGRPRWSTMFASMFQCPSTQYAFQALLTMASPEEALRALAVMHNYAPEEYKVCLGEGNISISLSVPT